MANKMINVIVAIGIVFVILMGLVIRTLNLNKYPSLEYKDNIEGEISIIKLHYGAYCFDLKNNRNFRVGLDDGNFDADELLNNYSDFDSVYKNSNSDTLYFIRDNKTQYSIIYYVKD